MDRCKEQPQAGKEEIDLTQHATHFLIKLGFVSKRKGRIHTWSLPTWYKRKGSMKKPHLLRFSLDAALNKKKKEKKIYSTNAAGYLMAAANKHYLLRFY